MEEYKLRIPENVNISERFDANFLHGANCHLLEPLGVSVCYVGGMRHLAFETTSGVKLPNGFSESTKNPSATNSETKINSSQGEREDEEGLCPENCWLQCYTSSISADESGSVSTPLVQRRSRMCCGPVDKPLKS